MRFSDPQTEEAADSSVGVVRPAWMPDVGAQQTAAHASPPSSSHTSTHASTAETAAFGRRSPDRSRPIMSQPSLPARGSESFTPPFVAPATDQLRGRAGPLTSSIKSISQLMQRNRPAAKAGPDRSLEATGKAVPGQPLPLIQPISGSVVAPGVTTSPLLKWLPPCQDGV